MSHLMTSLVIAAAIGSALVGGIFFAFSSFIMQSLARLPASNGISAMQSINVVVLNRSFLGIFLGIAALSPLLVVLAVVQGTTTPFIFSGAVLYFVGTFLVTMIGNVPLNNRLAAASAPDASAVPVWEHYLDRWTLFNTVRTVAAIGAALSFTASLIGGTNA